MSTKDIPPESDTDGETSEAEGPIAEIETAAPGGADASAGDSESDADQPEAAGAAEAADMEATGTADAEVAAAEAAGTAGTGAADTGTGAADTGAGAAEAGEAGATQAVQVAPGSFTAIEAVLAGAMSADGMGAAPARSRRKRVVVLSAAAVVIAVLAAGGAYAVVRQRWDKPTGALPEDRLPASVAAFARVNLTPGLGQRIKFEELLRKSRNEQFEDVKRELFEGLQAPITYADVAPWFDDRVGVAMWAAPAHPNKPVTLVAASTKDDKQARASLEAVQRRRGTDRVGFVVEDGYVLVALGDLDAQGTATAAAAEAKLAPLAKDAGFRSAVATLPGDQPAIGWADLAKANKLSPSLDEAYLDELYAGEGPPAGTSPAPSTGAAAPLALSLKGVAVVGVQALDDALEATVRLIGVDGLPLGTEAGKTDVMNALGALSGNASAAGVLAGPLGDLTKVLGPGAGYIPMDLLGGTVFAMGPSGTGALPPEFTAEDQANLEKYLAEHPEVFGDLGGGSIQIYRGGELPGFEQMPQPDKLAASLASGLGSAQSVSFTVAGKADEESGQAPLLIDLRMADAAAAARTQQELAGLQKINRATCEQHEEHVLLRSSTYAGATSRLADNALFKRAMAGPVASPVAAAYFTVDGPVQAVGVTAGHEGADTVLRVRAIVA